VKAEDQQQIIAPPQNSIKIIMPPSNSYGNQVQNVAEGEQTISDKDEEEDHNAQQI